MTLRFSIHFQLFEPQKIGFWVKIGKFWKFENFKIWLTSEALVPLLCFPKARKMFVCREELQTMILSTERPLYHVGELRYGPPKFFGVKLKIPENAFLSFESSWCVYITKMVLSGTNWSHMENNDHCWSFWGYLTGKQLVLSLKLLKNTTEKGQNQANPEQALFRANLSYKLPSKAWWGLVTLNKA